MPEAGEGSLRLATKAGPWGFIWTPGREGAVAIAEGADS